MLVWEELSAFIKDFPVTFLPSLHKVIYSPSQRTSEFMTLSQDLLLHTTPFQTPLSLSPPFTLPRKFFAFFQKHF